MLLRSAWLTPTSMACMTRSRRSSARRVSTGAGTTSSPPKICSRTWSTTKVWCSTPRRSPSRQRSPNGTLRNSPTVQNTNSTNDRPLASHYKHPFQMHTKKSIYVYHGHVENICFQRHSDKVNSGHHSFYVFFLLLLLFLLGIDS
jgi:hypothetical protein